MINVQILELDDIVLPTDWCRPLHLQSMSGGHSDDYSFSEYGIPCNNTQWIRVSNRYGKCWYGSGTKTVRDYRTEVGGDRGFHYEFVRGEIPDEHQLKGLLPSF